MNKLIINSKAISLLVLFLILAASTSYAQKKKNKKDITVKISFKLLETQLYFGDTATLIWNVVVPHGDSRVLLNGSVVKNEGKQIFKVDSIATHSLIVELPNGKTRKRTVSITPLAKEDLLKNSNFQELNKFRTSFLNCKTGRIDKYINLKELELIDSVSLLMDKVAETYKDRDEFCHEEKIEKIFAPLIEFYKTKNASVWVGIFANAEINYGEYCYAIKNPQFKRGYIGTYPDVTFLVLEAPYSIDIDKEVMQGAAYGKKFNISLYYNGSQYSQYFLFSYNYRFGKPCSCDTVLVHIDRAKMLKLINDTRAKGAICGSKVMPPVPPIKWNDTLEMVAFLHAKSMCVNDHYKHIGIDGSDPTDRASRLWYKYAVGENISMGYGSEEGAFNGWLNSPGHCENMLNRDKREVGVSRSGDYWTMNLGYTFVSREFEAKVREKDNQEKELVTKEIVSNINKNRKVVLTTNRMFPYNISDFSERSIPDDYNRGVQLYGGVKLNCTDFKTEKVLKSIYDNPKYTELLKDTIYTDIMIEPTIIDTRIVLYRPLSKIRTILIERFGLGNVLEEKRLSDLAFRQAKLHYYGAKESLKHIDFAPGTLKQMIERDKINCKQYEMVLVKDSSILTEVELVEYITTHSDEAMKIKKYQYNQIGYSRYKDVWAIIFANVN